MLDLCRAVALPFALVSMLVAAAGGAIADPAATAPPAVRTLDPACDPPDQVYGDDVAVAGDGTVFVGSIDCREIWRFAPGAHGNVAPAGILTTWKTSKYSIQAIGTSGSHLLVGGFSSVGVFAEDASGDDAPLRFIGDGKDDTDAATGLQNSVGGPVGVYADANGQIIVLENRAVHGYDGGFTVVRFAPAARGNVPPQNEFDPTALAKPVPPIPTMEPGGNPDAAREGTRAIALGAGDRLFALDWNGYILVSGPDFAPPFKPIAHLAGLDSRSTLALDGRGRIIVSDGAAIHVIAGATSGAPRESLIAGPKTTFRTAKDNATIGIHSVWTDAAGSIYVFHCDGNRGRVLTFAADAAGDVAPVSVLGGPATHLRC